MHIGILFLIVVLLLIIFNNKINSGLEGLTEAFSNTYNLIKNAEGNVNMEDFTKDENSSLIMSDSTPTKPHTYLAPLISGTSNQTKFLKNAIVNPRVSKSIKEGDVKCVYRKKITDKEAIKDVVDYARSELASNDLNFLGLNNVEVSKDTENGHKYYNLDIMAQTPVNQKDMDNFFKKYGMDGYATASKGITVELKVQVIRNVDTNRLNIEYIHIPMFENRAKLDVKFSRMGDSVVKASRDYISKPAKIQGSSFGHLKPQNVLLECPEDTLSGKNIGRACSVSNRAISLETARGSIKLHN
jgi:hypothetical protein